MAEYIEREAFIDRIEELHDAFMEDNYTDSPFEDGFRIGLERSIMEADNFSAADVAPVRHGKWVKMDMHKGMEQHRCSVCNQECYVPTCMGEPLYVYCPNCGAKMEVDNG